MKKERLADAIGHIDDKYVDEASGKSTPKIKVTRGMVAIAASFVLIIALSLYLFIPFRPNTVSLNAYLDSDYLPLIEKIAEYNYKPPRYKNNFEYLTSMLSGLFSPKKDAAGGSDSSDMNNGAPPPEDNGIGSSNGSYIENTDNQVAGVIESDIVKMTDKYIFRLNNMGLSVYEMKGEDSQLVTNYYIPKFDGEKYSYTGEMEMYLSLDATTITILKPYYNYEDNSGKVGIISLDISNVSSISEKAKLSIDGSYNSSRMVDGKLLLISEYFFSPNSVDYSNPETYVPSIDRGNGKECFKFEDLILPESMSNTRYSVVALFNEGDLALCGASALLNFTETIYVSEQNVFITRNYSDKTVTGDDTYTTQTKSDIAILRYSGEKLEQKGIITVNGTVKDQYSLDERDGYLRLVTTMTTNNMKTYRSGNYDYAISTGSQNDTTVSLYVFNLADNTLTAKIEDFAPEGETAESVRFDGDTAYVCTAVVVTFTDPVFFFDLSNYSDITYTDTGVIDGYSSSLINFGDGFLLGIGKLDVIDNKVAIYEQGYGNVVEVDSYVFNGNYSTTYKSYFIDRERKLFGFFVSYSTNSNSYFTGFILLHFDGYEIREISRVPMSDYDILRMRAVYHDGYIYLTSDSEFKFKKLENR